MTPTAFEIPYQKQKTLLNAYFQEMIVSTPCKNVNCKSVLSSLLERDLGFSRGVGEKTPSTTCSHVSLDSLIPLHVD